MGAGLVALKAKAVSRGLLRSPLTMAMPTAVGMAEPDTAAPGKSPTRKGAGGVV